MLHENPVGWLRYPVGWLRCGDGEKDCELLLSTLQCKAWICEIIGMVCTCTVPRDSVLPFCVPIGRQGT
jgi:hypothetical protein